MRGMYGIEIVVNRYTITNKKRRSGIWRNYLESLLQ